MHVLAIDQGTTGSTCLMIARDGSVAGRGYREIAQSYPHPGWVEHDPLGIFDSVLAAAREAIAAAGAVPHAVGITNQRETVVLWERHTGHPVHPAIVWQDRRTAARCAALAPQAAKIAARTGLVTDPYFSATKLEWLLALPGMQERAARGELLAGTIDSWLVWRLTGGAVHATDHSNASRTMLYDIARQDWDEELLALFGVPRALLPEIRRSSGDFGIADAAHFGTAIPIGGVAGDQQAALFGQGAWNPGDAKITYGTGAFLLLNTGAERPAAKAGLLTTIACDRQGAPVFALEAAIFIAGAAVQWLRDGLGIIGSAAETEPLAASLDGNDGVYFVPALVGLGAPDWEPEARGTIVGLTRGTTRAHLARAALEAMAYATLDVLADMRASGGVLERLRVDGGATGNAWLLQFQADVAGVDVQRPDMVETTALGAAGLAGIATGVWRDADEFLAARRFTTFRPGAGAPAAVEAHAGWRRAVRATLAWARDGGTALALVAAVGVIGALAPAASLGAQPRAVPAALQWSGSAGASVNDGGTRHRPSPPPSPDDQWFAADKALHFGASAVIQLMGYGLLRIAGASRGASQAGAAVATVAAGIGKEWYDVREGRRASGRDLVWDGLGLLAGVGAARAADPR